MFRTVCLLFDFGTMIFGLECSENDKEDQTRNS